MLHHREIKIAHKPIGVEGISKFSCINSTINLSLSPPKGPRPQGACGLTSNHVSLSDESEAYDTGFFDRILLWVDAEAPLPLSI